MIASVSQEGDSDRSNDPVCRIVRVLEKFGCPKWKMEGDRSYKLYSNTGVDADVISPPGGRSVMGELGLLV